MKKKLLTKLSAIAAAGIMVSTAIIPAFAETIDFGTFTNSFTPDTVNAEVSLTVRDQIQFYNSKADIEKYEADPGSADLTPAVNLSSKYTDGRYTFVLQEYDTQQTAGTTAQGNAIGDPIEVSTKDGYARWQVAVNETGTRYFRLTNKAVKNAYSGFPANIVTTATDDGTLTPKVNLGDALYTVTHVADPLDFEFTGTKVITDNSKSGRKVKNQEFSFTATDQDGAVLDAKNDADGNIRFDEKIVKPGTYSYFVAETAGSDSHFSYDTSKKSISFKVKLDSDTGKLILDGDPVVTK